METIRKIKRRIDKKESKSGILTFLSVVMLALSVLLGSMIYMKKDENGEFLAKNFGISCNFKTFNTNVNNLINSLFKLELNKLDQDQSVSNNIMYIEKGNNLFYTENQNIQMLHDGVILGLYQEEENYSILINYSNGVIASYSNVDEVFVKEFDELKKGDSIGIYNEDFTVLFKKDEKIISYNEAI